MDHFRANGHENNLDKLGEIYRTDKIGTHFYTQHYSSHFDRFRNKDINLLEIGVGGYDKPHKGGKSLRMWKKYFPEAQIYSIDIHDKSAHEENRINIFRGSQIDESFLNDVVQQMGDVDLIIDDGSHINSHVITTFKILFPKLKDGGIYVIEDTQTSYWADHGGDSENLNNPNTMMNFFKSLTDCLNHQELEKDDYQPNYFDQKITSIHFYHNLIFIYKGNNDEVSNRPKD